MEGTPFTNSTPLGVNSAALRFARKQNPSIVPNQCGAPKVMRSFVFFKSNQNVCSRPSGMVVKPMLNGLGSLSPFLARQFMERYSNTSDFMRNTIPSASFESNGSKPLRRKTTALRLFDTLRSGFFLSYGKSILSCTILSLTFQSGRRTYEWNCPSPTAEKRTPRSDTKLGMPSERQYITQSPPTSHLSLSATAVSPVTAMGCARSKKSILLHSSRPSTFARSSLTRPIDCDWRPSFTPPGPMRVASSTTAPSAENASPRTTVAALSKHTFSLWPISTTVSLMFC